MKYLLAILLLCGPAWGQESRPQLVPVGAPALKLTDAHWDAVVRVVCDNGDTGSGVLIKTGDSFAILTAAHVVQQASGATVTFRNGTRRQARALWRDAKGSDSAAVIIDDPGIAPIPVAGIQPRSGDYVVACGYGEQGKLIGQMAEVQRINGTDLWMVGKLRSGDSGGPVFNSDGQVCGVNSASSQPGATGQENIAASTEYVSAFVTRVAGRCGPGGCPPAPRGWQNGDVMPGQPRPPAEQPNLDALAQQVADKLSAANQARWEKFLAEVKAGACKCAEQKPVDADALAAAVAAKLEGKYAGAFADIQNRLTALENKPVQKPDHSALQKQLDGLNSRIDKAGITLEIYDAPPPSGKKVDQLFVPLGGRMPLYRYDKSVK
jgi:hypothetical protein